MTRCACTRALHAVRLVGAAGLESARDPSGWWSQPGSNRRPSGCKPDALPAELWPLAIKRPGAPAAPLDARPWPDMVGLGGVEPPTSPLSGVRSNQLSYRPGGQRRVAH